MAASNSQPCGKKKNPIWQQVIINNAAKNPIWQHIDNDDSEKRKH